MAPGLPLYVDRLTDVPWSKIVGMRHILVPDYFGIDTDLVWQVVEADIPKLKVQIFDLLRRLR